MLDSGHSQPRTHRGHDAKFPGMAITYALMERFEQLAETQPERAQLIKKARVTRINKEGNRAVGVVYELDGQEVTVDGPVVLATGGYAADFTDNSLLKKHRPDVYDLATTNGQHATGDGQKMLMAIGANAVDMDKVQVHPTGLIDPKEPTSKWKFLAAEGEKYPTSVDCANFQLSVVREAFSSTSTADASATTSATATTCRA
jgi:succinate dehydrogenase/fumarate reductase flavoprotein subunit